MADAAEALATQMTAWRRELHAHPEFGFSETRTSAFVAARLRALGLSEVIEGIGGTGVVGTLDRGAGQRIVGLRADMDCLRIHEQGAHAHRSTQEGLMHACGHDGHTAMLLGAAALLAADAGFAGTVRFVFQPAEEWGRGALAMLDDGLLDRFPIDEIYGVHNMPGVPLGAFETCVGPLMAAEDNFEIVLTGQGGHASRPHEAREVMVPACALVVALQTIVSRSVDPADATVVSVTELMTDGTRNALPGHVRILGDCRSFRPEVSAGIEAAMRRIAEGVAAAHGVDCEVSYTREFIPLINPAEQTAAALSAASKVFPQGAIRGDRAPITASEDFARLLERVPGCFAFLGNGTSAPLHSPTYDFDDRLLPLGARWFAQIARDRTGG
ncbi:MAG TPA: amidohydrolase [Caulobacteraceae bacterium]|jgi:hippurate hydrolase|nr:amidohydrolase [Caulobacteraceae bacterium]